MRTLCEAEPHEALIIAKSRIVADPAEWGLAIASVYRPQCPLSTLDRQNLPVRRRPIADVQATCEIYPMQAWPPLLLLLWSAQPSMADAQVAPPPAAPLAVEVWTGGDDGLTQRLADAVREEFRASPRFRMVVGRSGALRVIIPTHVGWRDIGTRTRVTYRLELERGGRRTAVAGGACWEADLRVCARQILQTVTAHR